MVAIEKVDINAFTELNGPTTADLNFEMTEDGAFPLLAACAKGNLAFLNVMLKNQTIDLDKCDRHGVNAFFMAAYHGHVTIMKRLMERGVNIFQKNSNGSNVMHLAVKRKQLEVIEELIRIKFPINEPKTNGITAVGIAAA